MLATGPEPLAVSEVPLIAAHRLRYGIDAAFIHIG